MIRFFRLLAVFALIGLLIGQSAGLAADQRIEAMALVPLDPGQSLEIRLSADSELSDVVEAVFRERLQAAGHSVAADRPLILSVTIQIDEFGTSERRRFAVEGRGGGRSGVQGDVSIRLGDLSSDRVAPRELKLRVTLGEAGRTPLWTGFAVGRLSGTDRLSLGRRLSHALMDVFGRSTGPPPALLE